MYNNITKRERELMNYAANDATLSAKGWIPLVGNLPVTQGDGDSVVDVPYFNCIINHPDHFSNIYIAWVSVNWEGHIALYGCDPHEEDIYYDLKDNPILDFIWIKPIDQPKLKEIINLMEDTPCKNHE